MDLSIIVVNWNTRDMLADCLVSILRHAPLCRFEVIVVDNGSEDGSQAMVRRDFPEVRLLEMQDNLGFAAANNVGFGAAEGAALLMLNSDTLVRGGVLQASLNYLQARPQVGAVGCRVLNADGSHQVSAGCYPSQPFLLGQLLGWSRLMPRVARRAPDRSAASVETLSGCFILMRRAVLDRIGGLDEAFFFFGEETDWCKRARAAGFDLHYAPVGEITHLGGGSSKPLRFKRDVMLSQATVRLHRKHGNTLTALSVYAQLFLFNASRSLFWTLSHALAPSEARSNRSKHFRSVVGHFREAWPTAEGR